MKYLPLLFAFQVRENLNFFQKKVYQTDGNINSM